jgi:hypothetical protein
MKKVLIFTNILFLGVAVFFGLGSCNNTGKTDIPPVDKTKCTSCTGYNDVGNTSTLDYNLVRAMVYNYQSDPSIKNSATPKTRSVWLSLEKLKQFVYQIESKTCGCDSALGVRVYFAQYPPDTDWTSTAGFKNDLDNASNSFRSQIFTKYSVATGGNNPYALLNTIVMVPTMRSGGRNIDFDPNDNPNGCATPGYNVSKYGKIESLEKTATQFLHTSFGSSITALSATNHGDACPPPIPCSTQGAAFDY